MKKTLKKIVLGVSVFTMLMGAVQVFASDDPNDPPRPCYRMMRMSTDPNDPPRPTR